MEDFKKLVCSESIATAIASGQPINKYWGLPDFLIKKQEKLQQFFGNDAFKIYASLSDKEKVEARKWFETHGIEASKMFNAELYEEPDGCSIFKYNMNKLEKFHPKIYDKVIQKIFILTYGVFNFKN